MSEPAPPPRVFVTGDGDLRRLAGHTIAFIGYGNQGRAQALNLRDSLRADSFDNAPAIVVGTARDESWSQAEADGFAARPVAEAAQAADVLFLLIPDEVLPEVYRDEIAPGLRAHDLLVFASGYNLAFAGVALPPDVDVTLLAPRMIGRQLRELYERGEGFYSYLAVEQDASGHAWPVLLALAEGIGTLRGGAFELSARDETLLDLYHEQGFGSLLGATMYLMLEVGIEAGIPPEALVLDLYLSGEAAQTMQAMAELGFYEQSKLHSRTSQYGGMMRTLALDREPLRRHLQRSVHEVRSGAFARQWAEEQAAGAENFEKLRTLAGVANPFTPIEQRLRAAIEQARAHKR
jgi:ketol-acid reductoisomerase